MTIKLNASVVAKIHEGVQFAGCAQDRIREAAKIAARDLGKVDPSNAKNIVDEVVSGYAGEFTGDNAHNLKAFFGDLIWCYACPTVPVSVPQAGGELHSTAGAITKHGKNRVREAAKQVREELGFAKAKGGGRKPKNPASAKGARNTPAASNTKPSGEAKLSRGDVIALVESLCDADISGAFSERIADVLKSQGYVVYKRTKK